MTLIEFSPFLLASSSPRRGFPFHSASALVDKEMDLGLKWSHITLSPRQDNTICVLNCTTRYLDACNTLANLSCICNSVAYQTETSTCLANICPDQAATQAALLQAQCDGITTISTSATSGSSTPITQPPSGTTTAASSTSTSPSSTSSQSVSSVPSASPDQGPAANVSPIIGGVVGGAVGLILIILVIWLYYRRRRKMASGSATHEPHKDSSPTLPKQAIPDDELTKFCGGNRDLISPSLECKLRDARYLPKDDPKDLSATYWSTRNRVDATELANLQEAYERNAATNPTLNLEMMAAHSSDHGRAS